MSSHDLDQRARSVHLEQFALKDLGIHPATGEVLAAARIRYLADVPGLEHMRNALTHFDEWSRGEGRGPQKRRVGAGQQKRNVAKEDWGLTFNPQEDNITFGTYSFHVPSALKAALAFAHAIYVAAGAVDDRPEEPTMDERPL